MKGKTDPGAARRGTSHRRKKPTELVPVEYSGAITPGAALGIPIPRSLPKTKTVKALWYGLLQEIARHELRVGDLPSVEALCVACYRHAQAGLLVKKYGMLMDGPMGPVKNPMLREERDQAVLLDRLAQRFGLSPEARIRLDLLQIAGATMLGTLKRSLDEAVDAEFEVIDQDG